MFGLLKNKLASFVKGLVGKEEGKKEEVAQPTPETEKKEQKPIEAAAPKEEEKKALEPSEKTPTPEEKPAPAQKPKPEEKKPLQKPEAKPASLAAKPEPKPAAKPEAQPTPKSAPPAAKPAAPEQKPVAKPDAKPAAPEPKPSRQAASPAATPSPPPIQKQPEIDLSRLERKASQSPEKRGIAPKIGLGAAIKSFFSSDITIGEAEVSDLLSELELSLLEADVAYDVSLDVTAQIRGRLVGMKVPKGKVEERTRQAIEDVLASVMESERKFDLVERVRSLPKPAKILFVGPNGAGKTTTMAKVAHMLMQAGLTCVFSASDTFRAAAIEQTEVHAGRLGVKVVKSKYGADPASVAFDAVNFARTHGIDAVLIDSAGRQDTNANLLDELKKISRVAKPDVKIYIGESIGGNALIDQVKAFNEAIGMDGAILTKIDCDAKGGTALSLTRSTSIPIIYLGVGQAYTDLVPFEPSKIAHEIMS